MDSNIVASSPFLRLAGLWTRDLPFRQTSILFSYRVIGRSENLGGKQTCGGHNLPLMVAIDESLCLKNAGAQISLLFTSYE